MYDEWSQYCRLLSWWAHENARWHRLGDSNLSNAFSDWMAPALTNGMHETTEAKHHSRPPLPTTVRPVRPTGGGGAPGGGGGGGGPIDFRIEGVLACVYKVVMSAVMSQIRWFWAVEKPDTGKALYCRNTEAVTPKFKLETVDWLCSYEQQNCNNWWFRVLLINNYN